MRSVLLFCTKIRMFLSELPPLVLLILSIKYNSEVEGLLGLWPLIIASSAFMLFIPIFLCRFISISYEEIRMIGVYSSKDSREINAGKTLKLILKKGRRLDTELWGIDEKPNFDWIDKSTKSEEETNLFRERAVGSEKSIKRVLSFFGVPKSDFDLIFAKDPYEKQYENVFVRSELSDKDRAVSIKILTTL